MLVISGPNGPNHPILFCYRYLQNTENLIFASSLFLPYLNMDGSKPKKNSPLLEAYFIVKIKKFNHSTVSFSQKLCMLHCPASGLKPGTKDIETISMTFFLPVLSSQIAFHCGRLRGKTTMDIISKLLGLVS